MSEMGSFDLAPGDPISQDGSLRAFRYSQFSACPSAPFNTAMPECLLSQFHLSASLATSSILKLEDHSPDSLREPSSSLLNSPTKSEGCGEGENCNSEGAEHLQHGESFSDSLGLSLFDAYSWSKSCESSLGRVCCDRGMVEKEAQVSNVIVSVSAQALPVHSSILDSPRRIYCDPRFLDEETQLLNVGLLPSNQRASCVLSPEQHLQGAPQAFDSAHAISETSATVLRKEENKSILDYEKTAAEPKKSCPLVAMKQECRAVVDFDVINQRWHSRTAPIPSSSTGIDLPSEIQLDEIRPSTSHASNSDYFRGQTTGAPPVNPGPSSANQMTSAAVEDADNMPKSYGRRRTNLSAFDKILSLADIGLPLEPKQVIMKPSTSDKDHLPGQPHFLDPENVSPSTTTNQDIVAAVGDADIVWRAHNRKRIALSAVSNLSSSSDSGACKKLKQASENVVGSLTVNSGPLQSQLVDDKHWCVPRAKCDAPKKDSTSPGGDSETTEEDVNVNDDADVCSNSELTRKLKYSRARGIKDFLQVGTARYEPRLGISRTKEFGVSKAEHAEEKWTTPRKNRPGGRQRTMDAWIK